MKRRFQRLAGVLLLLATIVGALVWMQRGRAFVIDESAPVGRAPGIRPDYTQTVIPPNIAPLNFRAEEPGSRYLVKMHSARGKTITVASHSAEITIPPGQWRELLEANRGESLFWDLDVGREDGHWDRFEPIRNTIAREDIDAYLAYRKIGPAYNFWTDVGVFQRDLTGYSESRILHSAQFPGSEDKPCINCHTLHNNRGDRMLVGIRSSEYGAVTLLAQNGAVAKLGTKFGYTSWHPSGRLVAYSANKVRQFFHQSRLEVREVVDLDSDLLTYQIGAREVKSAAGLADPDRLETYPTWSPDGRSLYFCSAPILWSDRETVPPERYEEVRYDLMRISYSPEDDSWGDPETVLASADTGLSILLPRISPDGKFLVFCMCQYGCFPVYQPSSDLYLLDLESGKHRRLECNSGESESWHSWSSNSRWLAFSSKRRDGVFTRSYLSYIDESGKAHKPFILPQRDPGFYDSYVKTYSVPELLVEPVRVSSRVLAEALRSSSKVELTMPDISMTRKSGGASPWRPVPARERE